MRLKDSDAGRDWGQEKGKTEDEKAIGKLIEVCNVFLN